MVLEMPSENKQCQGRGNIGGQLIHAVDEKDFEVAIDVFLNGADMVIEEEDRNVHLGRI